MEMMDSVKEAVRYIKNGELNLAKAYLKKAVEFFRKEYHQLDAGGNLFLAHYTSVGALKCIIKGNLRLYAADSFNDPDEGDFLRQEIASKYNFLDAEKDKEAEMPRKSDRAFVCSFVSGDRDVANKLMYWQSYGKDGLGCSIQPPPPSLMSEEARANFAKVRYGEEGFEKVEEVFGPFLEETRDLSRRKPEHSAPFLLGWLRECFSGIAYLYKSKDYESEKEYRIFVAPKRGGGIRYHYKNEPCDGPLVRKFIEPPNFGGILASGSSIMIGPRVRDKERIHEYLAALCHEHEIYGPEFGVSRIRYRKFW